MKLIVLPQTLAVCRLAPHEEIPIWVFQQRLLLSITYTSDELSIVCSVASVPADIRCEKPWQAIKVQGPLDFSLTGILASLTTPLAVENIPLFALSTFDTDYILVKEQNVERAKSVLKRHGHVFVSLEQ